MTEGVDIPWTTVLLTFWAYTLGIVSAYLHDYIFKYLYLTEISPPKNYAPLIDSFTMFYHRYLFGRISDCFQRPISSEPGAWIDIMERKGFYMFDNVEYTGKSRKCLNLGSYNYLGFAETTGRCLENDIVAQALFYESLFN